MRHRQMLGQIDGLEHELWLAQTEAMVLSRFPCEYLLYAKAYPITYPWKWEEFSVTSRHMCCLPSLLK